MTLEVRPSTENLVTDVGWHTSNLPSQALGTAKLLVTVPNNRPPSLYGLVTFIEWFPFLVP